MTKKITVEYLIDSLLPDHVVANYPRLVDFLKIFFNYLETQNKSSYYQNTLYLQRDIREQDPEFFEYITRELGRLSSGKFEINSKILYDQVVKIWQSKGTEESLIFLLKAIYGADDNTKVTYPRDFILRASDGIWNQERFITVEVILGTLPENVESIILVSGNIQQEVEISRLEIIDSQTTKFYFNTTVSVNTVVGQLVNILNDSDEIVYKGEITLSPFSIAVDDGGRDWQVGQLIRFPGTKKDTLARVSETNNIGTIKKVEILEYGYRNDENETFIVSPYAVKPVGASFDYTYDNATQTHTLTISDFTDGTIENVNGVSSDVTANPYFLENYAAESYSGSTVIQITTQDLTDVGSFSTTSPITLEEWLASRARLRYIFANQTTTRGFWSSNRGIISDSSIKLQDNYYYQQFSYDIETDKLRSEYKTLLDIIHVAGTKSFSTTALRETLTLDISLVAEIPFKFLYLDDIVETGDQPNKFITLDKSDDTTNTDNTTISFTKVNTESITSEDDIDNFSVIKEFTDDSTVDDSEINKQVIKEFDDSAVPTQVDVSGLYTEQNYFAEDYAVDAEPSSLQAELT